MLSEKAKEARRVYQQQWRDKNREHVREYSRKWREENQEKQGAAINRYWERKANELIAN
ncbi:hypothetical protein OEN36_002888 [Listeria monocytogenes]|uniref:hypothetical protein n=1 Tax=Listeria monocytogenes TaxID=1639 RepID=UPI000A572539|nr:hypothetical protein [Listeria monocytogenes]EJX8030923.1 hypothetical protein [Listeria monocytogenes]EJX8126600.1 hypothetical protein [Listeria monocytogenes]EJX8145133.1 hypothetical protein [Listeria monocytogenes]